MEASKITNKENAILKKSSKIQDLKSKSDNLKELSKFTEVNKISKSLKISYDIKADNTAQTILNRNKKFFILYDNRLKVLEDGIEKIKKSLDVLRSKKQKPKRNTKRIKGGEITDTIEKDGENSETETETESEPEITDITDDIEELNKIAREEYLKKKKEEEEKRQEEEEKEKLIKQKQEDELKKQKEQKEQEEFLRLKREGRTELIKKINKTLKTGEVSKYDVCEDLERYNLSTKDFLKLIMELISNNDKLVLKMIEEDSNEMYRVLNDENLNKLDEYSNENIKSVKKVRNESDAKFIEYYFKAVKYELFKAKSESKYCKFKGKFLCFTNNTDIDMSRYGLYKELSDNVLETINKNNCLLIALQNLNLSPHKSGIFKTAVKTRHISLCKLKEIATLMDITIDLHQARGTEIRRTKYGTNNFEVYKIGFLHNHFFVFEEMEYTTFSLKNYFEIKDIKDFNLINGKNKKTYIKDKKYATINTLKALRIFEEYNLMKPITNNTYNIFNSLFFDELETKNNDTEIMINKQDFKYADKKQEKGLIDEYEEEGEKVKYSKATFDFETFTNSDNKIVPYLCVINYEGEAPKATYGINCARDILKHINKDTHLLGHNAKFDYSFISEFLYDKQELFNGSKFISCKASCNKFKVKITDFYNLVAEPLSKMNGIFKLGDVHKEYMPYNLFNDRRVDILNSRYVNYDICMEYIKTEEDKKTFLENCEKWNCIDDDNDINLWIYSVKYCIIDCIVLSRAYQTFHKWIYDAFEINLNNCLTTSSISRALLQKRGVYKDCYKNSGAIQQYLKNFIVGGRVMPANNEKSKILDKTIAALDANSLYPSALIKTGFLKGTPKKLKDNITYEEISKYTHYFVRIKISSVGIYLKFPLLSVKNKDGILNFTNELTGDIIHYVDKTTLEDLIKFQKIEFKIIDGIYYDEGRNFDICKMIDELYKIRQTRVREENPIELVYKLVLNSIYGINIENEHPTKILNFNTEKEFNKYLDLNHESILEYTKINKSYRVYVKTEISSHFNCSHIGIDILSYSKRIMNEVICLSETLNLDSYYQDTDSIFMNEEHIDIIDKAYKKETGVELLGNELGQFKTDLKIKGCKEVKGSNAYFLGKKCYYIKMTGQDIKSGNQITKDKIRMAGVSDTAIEYELKNKKDEKGDKKFINTEEIYKSLYEGEAVSFDLCEYDEETERPGKFKVEYNKLNLQKTQRTKFSRTRQFK